MESIIHQVSGSFDTWYNFLPAGDYHVGAGGCDEGLIKRSLSQPGIDFFLDMGDDAECITPSDKRWDSKTIAPWLWEQRENSGIVDLQVKRAASFWKPYANKMLGVLESNHTKKISQGQVYDPTAALCDMLHVRNLGHVAQIHLSFTHGKKVRTFSILATHGRGGGAGKGNKLHKIHQWASKFPGYDLYLVGHGHEQLVGGITRLHPVPGSIVARNGLLVMTGTALKTYTPGSGGYGEQAGYEPVMLGFPLIRFHPDSLTIKVEISCNV